MHLSDPSCILSLLPLARKGYLLLRTHVVTLGPLGSLPHLKVHALVHTLTQVLIHALSRIPLPVR